MEERRSQSLALVANARRDLRRGMRAVSKANEGFGEFRVGVHGDVAGDVVEDVGFRQVVQRLQGAHRYGGWELAFAQAIEEHERGECTR